MRFKSRLDIDASPEAVVGAVFRVSGAKGWETAPNRPGSAGDEWKVALPNDQLGGRLCVLTEYDPDRAVEWTVGLGRWKFESYRVEVEPNNGGATAELSYRMVHPIRWIAGWFMWIQAPFLRRDLRRRLARLPPYV